MNPVQDPYFQPLNILNPQNEELAEEDIQFRPPVTLNNEEQKIIDFYTSPDWSMTATRINEYVASEEFKGNSARVLNSSKNTLSVMLCSGVLVTVPYLAAGVLSSAVNRDLRKLYEWSESGMSVVRGVVGVTAFYWVIMEGKTCYDNHISYGTWFENRKQREFTPLCQRLVTNSPRTEDKYICPISSEWMTRRVLAPDQRFYDEASIVRWLTAKEQELERARQSGANERTINTIKQTFSPIRGRFFQIQDLEFQPIDDQELRKDLLKEVKISDENQITNMVEDVSRHVDERGQGRELMLHVSLKIQNYITTNNLPNSILNDTLQKLREKYPQKTFGHID